MLNWLNALPASKQSVERNLLIDTPRHLEPGASPKTPHIPNHGDGSAATTPVSHPPKLSLADLLAAVEPFTDSDDRAWLKVQAEADPDNIAALCRCILSSSPDPTIDEIAELDGLIVRFCELVPWAKDMAAELLITRGRMAPAHLIKELSIFRTWVRAAETRAAGLMQSDN